MKTQIRLLLTSSQIRIISLLRLLLLFFFFFLPTKKNEKKKGEEKKKGMGVGEEEPIKKKKKKKKKNLHPFLFFFPHTHSLFFSSPFFFFFFFSVFFFVGKIISKFQNCRSNLQISPAHTRCRNMRPSIRRCTVITCSIDGWNVRNDKVVVVVVHVLMFNVHDKHLWSCRYGQLT